MGKKTKSILLLGAGIEQMAAIRLAQGMGLYTIAADGNPHAPGLQIADRSFCLNIRDIEAVTNLARRERVDGVFSHAVEIPHVVAAVAKAAGLPGLDPAVALRATNKRSRYECLAAHHVPCPRHEIGTSLGRARELARDIGFPVVMKPLDNAGARGVSIVRTREEVERGFNWALQFSKESEVLIEEYLEGPELSTESVIVDGQIITTGFADRNYDRKRQYEPYCIENGHTIPTELSALEQADVIMMVEQAIRALGIDWGVAKGDVILTADGPTIFEMAARTSGGRFCSDMVPLATGVNILKPLIRMAVGEEIVMEELSPQYYRGAAQRFLFPPVGDLVNIVGLEEARSLPGVYDVVVSESIRNGGHVGPVTNHGDRVGHVIGVGGTRQEAVERAEQAVASIHFDMLSPMEVGR